MNIQWDQIATWTLQFLSLVLTWPVCTLISVVIVVGKLGPAISDWLANLVAEGEGSKWSLRRGSTQATSTTAPANADVAQGNVVANREDLPPFPPNTQHAQSEQRWREWSAARPANSRESDLIRQIVVWQFAAFCEWCYSFILGAQLDLLRSLRVKPILTPTAKEFYELGRTRTPPVYANYQFEAWLSWMRDTARIIDVDAEIITLNYEGMKFLEYIESRQYPMEKAG